MTEYTKETVTTQRSGFGTGVSFPVSTEATSSQTVEYLVYFTLGVVQIFLAFRLVLKLMGASTESAFVNFVYSLTGVLIYPFEGIFRRGFTQGIETTSVLEPATIVAIIVYAVLAWGIVRFTRIFSGEQQA